MLININNYSLCNLSETSYDINNQTVRLENRHGCNGFVRSSRKKYLYLAIPKKHIENVLKTVKEQSNNDYSLDDVLEIFKEMSFNYDYTYNDGNITFMDESYKGFYLFKIENSINQYHRYYAFCMIRHFYYGENILINYLNSYKELPSELDKIIALSIFNRFTSVYSFVGNILPLDKEINFKELLSLYYIMGGNCNNTGLNIGYIDMIDNPPVTEILAQIQKLKEQLLNYKPVGVFKDENLKETFKAYILEELCKASQPGKTVNVVNLSEKTMKAFRKYSDYVNFGLNGYTFLDRTLSNIKNFIIPAKPSIINILSKTIPNKKKFVEVNTPEYVVNINKASRKVYDCMVINSSEVLKNLKKRTYINALCEQPADYNFPYKLVRSVKTLKEQEFIINNEQELTDFKAVNNIRLYIKKPILNNSKKHYLFFTKNELFLYQVKTDNVILDNSCDKITDYMLKDSSTLIKKCHNIFKNSLLDIGVITLTVDVEANKYFIDDITSFVENGDFATTAYLNQINKILK